MMEFDAAIKVHRQIGNPHSITGTVCGEMIIALENKSREDNTAISLSNFWKIFGDFTKYTILQAAESRICKSLIMLSSCRAYSWVLFIATNATERPSEGQLLWFQQLGRDVERHSNQMMFADGPSQVMFNSELYLPSLLPARQASVKLHRWTYNEEKQKHNTVRAITEIIETWLGFPSNCEKVRSAIICTLTKQIPLSVLFLDEVWMAYFNPYPLVIHGNSKQRISDKHTNQILLKFEKAIQNHDLVKPESKERQMLVALQKQVEEWLHLMTSKAPKTVQEVLSFSTGVSAC
jgi:hypothetical protein